VNNHLRVKNWDSFQQYKDRDPKWIKLHRDILNDYDFDQLSEINQLHLMKIWLLASKLDNKIPNDAEWISRQIGAKSKVDIKQLCTSGFLIPYTNVHKCTQTYLETETETETETEKYIVQNEFARWWKTYPKKVGKKPALAIWKRIKPKTDLLIADVENRIKNDRQWMEGFIPNPTTYLNQERWNDELQQSTRTLSPADEYAERSKRTAALLSKINGSDVGPDDQAISPAMDEEPGRDRGNGLPRLVG